MRRPDTLPRRRQPRNHFDRKHGREMLRAIAALTTPGGDAGECWDWLGAYSTSRGHAYPALSVRRGGRRRVLKVHRVAYAAAYGPIPKGMTVHHRCGRSVCVRPEHLQSATSVENTAEMHARRSLEARVRTLTKALEVLIPDHPLLED